MMTAEEIIKRYRGDREFSWMSNGEVEIGYNLLKSEVSRIDAAISDSLNRMEKARLVCDKKTYWDCYWECDKLSSERYSANVVKCELYSTVIRRKRAAYASHSQLAMNAGGVYTTGTEIMKRGRCVVKRISGVSL